jgi:hypothetical protein
VPKPLAEIVLEEGLATRAAVERAAEVADRDGTPLVIALVRTCGIDEVALVAALRRHARVSLGDPATVAPEPDAVREISRDLCRRLRVAPLAVSSYGGARQVLRLAMADPTDAVAVAEIEHHSGCRVEPVLMTVSAVEELVEETYRHFVTEVMHREPIRAEREAATAPQAAPVSPGEREGRTTAYPRTGAPGSPAGRSGPTTVPYHRLADEVDLAVKLEALTRVLLDRGLVGEDELEEAVRQLRRRHEPDG